MQPAPDAAQPLRGFGPPGTTGTSHTLAIRDVAIKVSGIELTLQVDDGGMHSFVLFGDLYDERRQRMPLVNITDVEGHPSMAPLRVPFDAERIAIDLVSPAGDTSPELSCVYDFENDRFLTHEQVASLPLGASPHGGPALASGSSVGTGVAPLPGWGPVGATTFPRAVTLTSLEARPTGEQDLRLAVDDGGRSMGLQLTMGARQPFDVQLTRSEGGPTAPGLAWLVLPPGTDCLGFAFVDGTGRPLPELACRFLVRTARFIQPGVTAVTDERSLRAHPILNEILDSEPEASCGPPGVFVYQQALNVTGIRPAGGGIRLVYLVDDDGVAAQLRWTTDRGGEPTTLPLYRLPLYGDAGPAFSELVVPPEATVVCFELFDVQGRPLADLTATFGLNERRLALLKPETTQRSRHAAVGPRGVPFTELPIDYRLLGKPVFGPPGLLGHPHTLAVASAERSGHEPLTLSLLLDDGGRHTRVCWWNELLDYEQEVGILRATPSSPAVVELAVPRPTTRLFLDFTDGYDRSSPELSCIFYLEDGTLGPQQDALRSPATEKFPLRDRLSKAKVLCACCRKPKHARDATHTTDLPAE